MGVSNLALAVPFSVIGIVALGVMLFANFVREGSRRSGETQRKYVPSPPAPRRRRRRRYVRVLIVDTTDRGSPNDCVVWDRRCLEALFAFLNETSSEDVEYDVVVEKGLTGDAILNAIKDTDPEDSCMFACFILARGSVSEVVGVDGQRCSTRELTCALRGTMWESIPKVFCVQVLQDGRSATSRRCVVMEELLKNTFFFMHTATVGDGFIANLCNAIRQRAPSGWSLPVIFTEAMSSTTASQAPYFISTLNREYTFPVGKPCTRQHRLDRYELRNARVLILKVGTSRGPSAIKEAIDHDVNLLKMWLGSQCKFTVEVRSAEDPAMLDAVKTGAQICFVLWNCSRMDHGSPNWNAAGLERIADRFASNAAGNPKVLVFQAYGSDFNSKGNWAPHFPVGPDTLLMIGSLKVTDEGSTALERGGIVEHLVRTAEDREDGLWLLRDVQELRRKVDVDVNCDAVFLSTLAKELVLSR